MWHCGYSEFAECRTKDFGPINFMIVRLLLIMFMKICDNWQIWSYELQRNFFTFGVTKIVQNPILNTKINLIFLFGHY